MCRRVGRRGGERREKHILTRSQETCEEKGVRAEIKRGEKNRVKLIKTREEEGGLGTKTARRKHCRG